MKLHIWILTDEGFILDYLGASDYTENYLNHLIHKQGYSMNLVFNQCTIHDERVIFSLSYGDSLLVVTVR